MKKNNLILILATILICMGLLYSLSLEDKVGERVSNIITIITAIIGASALFIQFRRDKKINEANFMVSLSCHFYDQVGPREMFNKLERYNKGEINVFTKEDYANIVVYLEWCEEVACIANQNLLEFSWMDDLFSYRFFLAVNNKYVQDNELIEEYDNYVGIYKLHKRWEEYKKKKGLKILHEETSLSKTKNYNK